jgi:hypothetical protein
MEFGNKYAGCSIHKDYLSIFICPIGIELYCFNEDFELNLIFWPLQVTLGLGRNRSLFRG